MSRITQECISVVRPLCSLAVLVAFLTAGVSAQSAAAPQPIPSPAPLLASPLPALPGHPVPPQIKHIPPVPNSSTQVDSFVQSLSAKDAAFEVVIGQTRLLTVEKAITNDEHPDPHIAVGDSETLAWHLVDPRHIRVTGLRLGKTDLSVIAADGTTAHFEVVVMADLSLLRARLRQSFPDAVLELGQIRDHIVVEGQARDTQQVSQIIQMINAYVLSLRGTVAAPGDQTSPDAPVTPGPITDNQKGQEPPLPPFARLATQATLAPPQVINLIRVPGPQQVMLRVQVAELNRTALRELGVSFLSQGDDGGGFGQNVGGLLPFGSGGGGTSRGGPSATVGPGTSTGSGGAGGGGTGDGGASVGPLSTTNLLTAGTPLFGLFDGGDFAFYMNALRRNDIFKVLAEPNLVAMQGQEASFLAGGEFPVPVPQATGAGGAVITVEYREFGVGLSFVPFIINGDRVRLSVAPEVSSLDFSQGISLQGFSIPSLNKRRTSTVVELGHGQTLAISGLLQLEMNGTTSRIPGLGDLPYIGAFFRSNSLQRSEKELVILVTPYLIAPMDSDQVPPLPGDGVHEANDREFYLLGHLESLYGHRSYRSTAAWADPLGVEQFLNVQKHYVRGPNGYSQW